MSNLPLEFGTDRLEDFWRRRQATPSHQAEYCAYGYPYHFATNDPALLACARISTGRYSSTQPLDAAQAIHMSFILDRARPADPLPDDWPARLRHMGWGAWLTISAEPWVHAFADLERWIGVACVSPALAERPYMLSRFIGDCFVLNMLMRSGWGQLHASCLTRGQTAILLLAPHNTGKSTTAMHLALNGYALLSDGMTYVRVQPAGLELLGYPVGEVKLRLDVLDQFPQLHGLGERALIREDEKMVIDLRRVLPACVVQAAIHPRRIIVCLLDRHGSRHCATEPMDAQRALAEAWPDSAHVDDADLLRSHRRSLEALFCKAECYRVSLGSDGKQTIVREIDALLARRPGDAALGEPADQ